MKSISALTLMGLLAACSGASDITTSDDVSAALFVSGSVGDGPIVDAAMTVVDANGTVVLTGMGDSTANYQIAVPDDTLMPVTIRANGGTDLVTGRAADFEWVAVATASGAQTINVSPLSTLAVQMTRVSPHSINADPSACLLYGDTMWISRSSSEARFSRDITVSYLNTVLRETCPARVLASCPPRIKRTPSTSSRLVVSDLAMERSRPSSQATDPRSCPAV